ncbi:VanW family protein [Natranaerobius trueperi]|uniref:YoaR-like putative peptidoglycan binding domain-containing protein n=1 Tax=Natranaerobius trueperi TaxID=759412 RepID=A0A226BVS7_9FIRM|nr:VanW family protein [Natranaerobius trueperi]OWZ83096.1 hypothetical protein CDO51_10370 [Natranaerobius trueperi]
MKFSNLTKKQKIYCGICLVVFLCIILVISLDFGYRMTYSNKYNPSTFLAGKQVQGLNYEEGNKLIEEKITEIKNKDISLIYDDYRLETSFEELGIHWSKDKTHKELISEEMSFGKGIKHILGLYEDESEIKLQFKKDETTLDKILKKVSDDISKNPKDAQFKVDNLEQKVRIIPHEEGYELDKKQSKDNILDKLELVSEGKLETEQLDFELTTRKVPVDKTSDDLKAMNLDSVIGSFATSFSANEDENRVANISLAADYINETLIKPKEQFSFNETVGPINKENGYKTSSIIVDGEFVDGVGGGVCQVSSTVYNSVLKTGIEPVERYPHGRPVGYVGLGRDATVAYDYLDLVVENTLENPILFSAFVDENEIQIDVFGSEQDYNYTVQKTDYTELQPEKKYKYQSKDGIKEKISKSEKDTIISEYLDKEDIKKEQKNLEQLDIDGLIIEKLNSGRTGHKIDVWLVKKKEQQEIDKQHLSTDVYPSEKKVYLLKEE